MFGTILADSTRLTPEQAVRYKACYCGLCQTIKKEYGNLSRLVLSYDLTFLILLLSSLYEPEESSAEIRCILHPINKRHGFTNRFTSYAAAMNVALAFHKCMDDWNDDRNLLKRGEARLLKKAAEKVKLRFSEKCRVMENCLKRLWELEQNDVRDPDAAAACFGELTGELFVYDSKDHWAPILRRLGDSLGRFIYLSDALLDLKSDEKKGRYNPLKGHADHTDPDSFLPVLKVILGDCTEEMNKLPLIQDIDILENILYSGVWIPFATQRKKDRKERKG